MRWTNREIGIWELCRTRWLWIRGTTPTNAGIWTLDVALGYPITRPAVWLWGGSHFGFELWFDGDRSVRWERKRPRGCLCYWCVR